MTGWNEVAGTYVPKVFGRGVVAEDGTGVLAHDN